VHQQPAVDGRVRHPHVDGLLTASTYSVMLMRTTLGRLA